MKEVKLVNVYFTTADGKEDETQIDVDASLVGYEVITEIVNTILSLKEEMNIYTLNSIEYVGRGKVED